MWKSGVERAVNAQGFISILEIEIGERLTIQPRSFFGTVDLGQSGMSKLVMLIHSVSKPSAGSTIDIANSGSRRLREPCPIYFHQYGVCPNDARIFDTRGKLDLVRDG